MDTLPSPISGPNFRAADASNRHPFVTRGAHTHTHSVLGCEIELPVLRVVQDPRCNHKEWVCGPLKRHETQQSFRSSSGVSNNSPMKIL